MALWNFRDADNLAKRRHYRRSETKLNGLTAGTVYTVQVRAIGAAGPSDWSDPATLMVI
jgi:hypothetical protein